MKPTKRLVLAGALITLFISGNVAANDGTPPWIHELVQNNTNVNIKLGIVYNGEPGIDDAYRIERDGPEGEADVIDDKTFEEADAVSTVDRCRHGWDHTDLCASDPGDCLDCDGDSVLECNTMEEGWCETVLYFEVVDWCVPAGSTTYSFFKMGNDYTEDDEAITVEEWTEDCEPPAADTDTDTDGDTDSDSDGCSIVGTGVGGQNGLWASLMLLAGVAVLITIRRKSHK